MNLLAWWGAILSSILALIKIYEFWNKRFRIDVTYEFTSSAEVGNKILLTNLSPGPIVVQYWELHWVDKNIFSKSIKRIGPEPQLYNVRINSYETHTFEYKGFHHFEYDQKDKIYIELHIAGRRKKHYKVFP